MCQIIAFYGVKNEISKRRYVSHLFSNGRPAGQGTLKILQKAMSGLQVACSALARQPIRRWGHDYGMLRLTGFVMPHSKSPPRCRNPHTLSPKPADQLLGLFWIMLHADAPGQFLRADHADAGRQ